MRLIKLWESDLQKAYELHNSFGREENGFVNTAYGYSFEEFIEYSGKCRKRSEGIDLPEGFVPDTIFILVDDKENYIGRFNLRHCLNDFLAEGPGHIGFIIRREKRGMGYASKGLELTLKEAKRKGINEVYLSVNKDNPASLKVQQKNMAFIHHEDDTKYYTRILL